MYGLLITIGIILSVHLAEVVAKSRKITSELIWRLAFRGLIFGLIGARLYHVVAEWELYSKNPISIIFVWNGGLGILGGVAGGLLGIYLSAPKKYFLRVLDIFASVIPLGQAIGRWGNFFNGELLPYAIYESLADILLFVFLQLQTRKLDLKNKIWKFGPEEEKKNPDGTIFAKYIIGYSIIRLILDKFHNARWIIEKLTFTQDISIANFNITQTIAILMLLLSLVLLWKLKKSKKL
ncbi:prolipoprotein diacylglyceryl transferase [candidate division WWE3 bacterium]|nr:prolipoprotein diacylglyceryl transferase [candidate division WWE3 bacterium]